MRQCEYQCVQHFGILFEQATGSNALAIYHSNTVNICQCLEITNGYTTRQNRLLPLRMSVNTCEKSKKKKTKKNLKFVYALHHVVVSHITLPVLKISVCVTQQIMCIPMCTTLGLSKPPWLILYTSKLV